MNVYDSERETERIVKMIESLEMDFNRLRISQLRGMAARAFRVWGASPPRLRTSRNAVRIMAFIEACCKEVRASGRIYES